jgi:hypothetical protein
MFHKLSPLLVALIIAAPAVSPAQTLNVPTDWTWRLDGPQRPATEQEVKRGEWRYEKMPPGWHVTTTEQGVTLLPKDRTVSPRYGIEVELFLFPDPSDSPLGVALEPAGGDGSRHIQLLMRRDGMASIVARTGSREDVLAAWKADTAVKAHAGGVIKYVLRIMREDNSLSFAINGRPFFTIEAPRDFTTVVPGLRIGPGLNLHISRFDLITPLAPAPPPKQPGGN